MVLVPRLGKRSGSSIEGGSSEGPTFAWNAYVFRATEETLNLVGERVVDGPGADLAGWLGTWRPARAIVVLPPSATICRSCVLPPLRGEQLISALRLQAETAFMGGVPSHRVAMAVLPESIAKPDLAHSGDRQGVIIGWPESSAVPTPPSLPEYTDLSFTATIAALLGLIGGTPLSEPVIRADRHDRTVLFALNGPHGLLLRSTIEDADDEGMWRDGVLRAAAETLISNDASVDDVVSIRAAIDDHLRGAASVADSSFLALPTAVRESVLRRLPASSFDATRAIALGAMLATGKGAAGAGAANLLGDLTRMRASLPRPKPQPLQLALLRLQSPRIAGTVIAASIAAFVFSPLVFAVVRNGILRLKLDNVAVYEGENRLIRQKAALYGTLSRTTWPMTKLLGDLSNALPDTVEVESIQINAGQGITIRGMAKPTDKPSPMSSSEVALSFESRARDSGIFSEFQWDIEADDGRGSEFTVVCNVKNPIKNVAWKAEEDNALKSRRDRLYPNWQEIEKGSHGSAPAGSASAHAGGEGDEPRPTPPSGPDRHADPKSRPEPPKSTRTADASKSHAEPTAKPSDPKTEENGEEGDPTEVKVVEGDTKEGEKDRPGAASDRGINRRKPESGANGDRPAAPQPSGPKVEIPAPFTDDELNGMSLAQAKEFLGKISLARSSASLDDETKNRLKADFDRVLERLKELQRQKAGS
ncbi:MAG: hypothetical protein JNL80_05855 [Phycisphaerae bacterium]|nr:hypothetical protein [Phycisphaerae bacterium]